jgi:hypothetical protein
LEAFFTSTFDTRTDSGTGVPPEPFSQQPFWEPDWVHTVAPVQSAAVVQDFAHAGPDAVLMQTPSVQEVAEHPTVQMPELPDGMKQESPKGHSDSLVQGALRVPPKQPVMRATETTRGRRMVSP